MAKIPNYHVVNNLKKKIRLLEKKEAIARVKLRNALNKVKKLGKSYRTKLTSQMRILQKKFAHPEASNYAKAALALERQLLKGIERKAKALATAAALIEKKSAVSLGRGFTRKKKVVAKKKRTPSRKSRAVAKKVNKKQRRKSRS